MIDDHGSGRDHARQMGNNHSAHFTTSAAKFYMHGHHSDSVIAHRTDVLVMLHSPGVI